MNIDRNILLLKAGLTKLHIIFKGIVVDIQSKLQNLKSGFHKTFWVANGMELFERLAYYGQQIVFMIYMRNNLGFSEAEAGQLSWNVRRIDLSSSNSWWNTWLISGVLEKLLMLRSQFLVLDIF